MCRVDIDVVDAVGLQKGGHGCGRRDRYRIRIERPLRSPCEACVGYLRGWLCADERTEDVRLKAHRHDAAARVRIKCE